MKPRYKVNIIESERGWGQKIDEIKYFKTKKEAEDFVTKHNKKNNESAVPDIYWKAEMVGLIDLDEELSKKVKKGN